MQLSKPKKIRTSLALASSTLLCVAPVKQALSEQGPLEISVTQLYYSETDRVTVNKQQYSVKKEISDEEFVTAEFVYDTMTGASPNGRWYDTAIANAGTGGSSVTVTTASGFSFQTANATNAVSQQVWYSQFKDERKAGSLSWDKPWLPIFKTTLGVNGSWENDYRSLGANALGSIDLNQRRTTISAGANINRDTVDPEGGIPEGGIRLWCTTVTAEHPDAIDCSREAKRYLPANKIATNVFFGFTQIWNSRTVAQINYTRSNINGYITDPYKQLSIYREPTLPGETAREVAVIYEKRPTDRNSQSIFFKMVHVEKDNTANVSYRYFWDDWNIRSHTFDVRFIHPINKQQYFQLHSRLNKQSAASFFTTKLDSNALTIPEYISADHRLGGQSTFTFGGKIGTKFGDAGSISMRIEHMQQSYSNNPLPIMNAWIMQFIMDAKF